MLTYTGYKISILEGKQSIDIVQAVRENYFDDSHVFGAQQGLNFAIAVFSDILPISESTVEPSYGKIVFRKFKWEQNEDGNFDFSNFEIKSHHCSAEELGLTGRDRKF